MEDSHIAALLLLAGIEYKSLKRIPNEYCGPKGCEICARHPWWLVETRIGVIKIGWRKRVINIDWTAFEDVFDGGELTKDDTTKGPGYIHAWGYGDAISYLKTLFVVHHNRFWESKDREGPSHGQL